jgi:Fe-S-cluster containining protein
MPNHENEALRVIYDDARRLLEGWSCDDSADCCRFGSTGREPYVWPVEWALLARAISARGAVPKRSRLAIAGNCPLLDRAGRCTVYDARPFGCRTFFCDRAKGPERRPPRAALAELGRRIATLSERAEPGSGPRPLTRLIG